MAICFDLRDREREKKREREGFFFPRFARSDTCLLNFFSIYLYRRRDICPS